MDLMHALYSKLTHKCTWRIDQGNCRHHLSFGSSGIFSVLKNTDLAIN
jgi:hypothetical protein